MCWPLEITKWEVYLLTYGLWGILNPTRISYLFSVLPISSYVFFLKKKNKEKKTLRIYLTFYSHLFLNQHFIPKAQFLPCNI